MPPSAQVPGRDPAGLTLLAVGTACVVAGGLVSAVTGPLELSHGSWLAAYLVLVAGVGQCAMGAARLAAASGARAGWTQVGAWNVGNTLVIAGTLLSQPVVVDLGGLACVLALVVAALHSRLLPSTAVVWVYRVILVVLLVSVPIGLVLAQLRDA